MSLLKISVRHLGEEDVEVELSVKVEAGGFAGFGRGRFRPSELIAWGKLLETTFPLASTNPLVIRSSEEHDGLKNRVGLSVYPIGLTGDIGCRVELASTHHRAGGKRLQSVSVELLLSYDQLSAIGRALSALVRGHARLLCVNAR